MAFLIPDNLKSRKDVPDSIRRVASAFQMALDDSATVWFEPLFDPTGEKPHLVVLLPDRGIVVLEVLTKSGGFLGAVRGNIRLSRDGKEVEVGNPLQRAEKLAAVLQSRVGEEGRLRDDDVPVAAGAVLSSITIEEGKGKGLEQILPEKKCLFKNQIDKAMTGDGEAEILRAFSRVLGKAVAEPMSEEKEKILRGLIQPETVIDRADKKTSGRGQLTIFRPPSGGEDVIRVMDRKQEAMAKSLGEGHRVIRGVAGSGKTLILVHRARLLARLFPKKKFLFTCYTRSLAGQLRTLLSEYKNIDVVNLDRVMSDLIKSARMKHPGYKNDSSGEEVAQAALKALSTGAGPRYQAVLLDEAQDFGTTALMVAVGLLEDGSEDLIIVADSAQNIFRRQFSWKKAGIQAQGRTRILRLNYRNTKEILEFANNFLLASSELTAEEAPDPEDEHTVIPPEAASRNGEQPELQVFRDPSEEARKVVERIKSWAGSSRGPRQIAALYATSKGDRANGVKEVIRGLEAAGVGSYWLSNPRDWRAKDGLAAATEQVVVSSIHSSKGLEFPNVLLFRLDQEDTGLEEARKLIYVGMTRATERLSVLAGQDHPLVKDLQGALAPQ